MLSEDITNLLFNLDIKKCPRLFRQRQLATTHTEGPLALRH